MISVQSEDFDHGAEYQALRDSADGDGAIVTFTGIVRDMSDRARISAISLEHYPGMVEKSLAKLCVDARQRWPLGQIRIIHRVGTLNASDQIVFVGVSSEHRRAAFEAAEYIMDFLKTRAPLWKMEHTAEGKRWVEARASDQDAAARW